MLGRPPKSTRAQRKRVFELADAGLSSRQIAEQVFGDRRLKNRVLRLAGRRKRGLIGGVDPETATEAELELALSGVYAQIAELDRADSARPRESADERS